MKVSVILPAAGLGTRMKPGGASRKQFMELDGEPVVLHTIRKFAACPEVGEVVLAVRAEDRERVAELLSGLTFAKPVRLVEGGDTRQHSVENALASLGPEVELVAVHDAVRPFIRVETITLAIEAARESGAAIVGIVPVDTVKQVHLHKVRGTLNRDRLVLAQTPQVFRADLLREAFAKARADEFVGTDESSLVERLETVEVTVVPGSDRNIKITRPSDIDLAHLFLKEEKERAAGNVPSEE
ncbi:MAG TPA: 2-C-methyl-D-erythritol 4-phosphate cytidylyltransferase [Bryobacteraceae bacterium]|nr:2-C-methyl-D-erythritol 4-phosphate cytidylyltransferase [Bryobacterales bacterium]HRJ19311.1 2-C-methyl-D-erythritol 4-phosphate cytidylyltransferase [Bryobacteraceae bacterium]